MTTAHRDDIPAKAIAEGGAATAVHRFDVNVIVCSIVSKRIGRGWKPLGRSFGMEESELSDLEEMGKRRGLFESAYLMLKKWKMTKSREATIWSLAWHVKEIGDEELAYEILNLDVPAGQQRRDLEPLSLTPRSASEIWAAIKSSLKMKHQQRTFPNTPWLKDREIGLESYFVDLRVNNKSIEQSTLHFQDMFIPKKGEINPPTRILIEGPAGYGKSTLACKLCHDHANEKNYIRHFDAVILLHLRNFEGTLKQMIADAVHLTYSAEDVFKSIAIHEDKFLIILDGFDELPDDKHSHIIPLLMGKMLPYATVIAATRFGCINLKTENEESTTFTGSRILIRGITEENRIRFLKLFLCSDSVEKVASCISLVENRCNFFEESDTNLFHCPLFLALLIVVNQEVGLDSIKTKTELYKTLFNFMLRRTFEKEGQLNQSLDFFVFNENNPPEYVQMLYQFGLFAGKALKERKFSFDKEDILRRCGGCSKILKLGILIKKESEKGQKRITWYEPIHITFLEFSLAYATWIRLVCTPYYLSCFSERCGWDFFRFTMFNSVLPFLFGLCGKQLAVACSALRLDRNDWLRAFTGFYAENELIAESQLEVSEIAKAFSSLIPSGYASLDNFTASAVNTLFKETLMHAMQIGQISGLIVVGSYFSVISEQCSNLPLQVKYSSDKEIWGRLEGLDDLITHQILRIYNWNPHGCKFVLQLCNSPPTEQLRWLSKWLIFEGLYFDKPIQKVYYDCPESLQAETLRQIAQLISEEKVVSVTLETKNHCIDHSFGEFFQCANRSAKLEDIHIQAHTETPLFVELGRNEGKRWRKVDLRGNVIPRVGNLPHSLEEFCTLNESNVIRELPSRINTFHLSSCVPGCMPLNVFVQRNGSLICQNIREMLITFKNDANHLLELLNSGYLDALEVLAIAVFTDTKLNGQDIISSILSVISHCRLLVRLELCEGWTEVFIATLLQALSKENLQARRNQPQRNHKNFLLDTLVLSHEISGKNGVPKDATADLAKGLLLSGVLRELCLRSTKRNDGYAKAEFIKLFSPAEGFIFDIEEKPIMDNAPWDWAVSYFERESMILLKISVEKPK